MAVLDRLGYVGVLAIELFQVGEGLLGNEMAPRVHNSGHWTIEGARTSQFENHLRAIYGLPLGRHDRRSAGRHGQPDRDDASRGRSYSRSPMCIFMTTGRSPGPGGNSAM